MFVGQFAIVRNWIIVDRVILRSGLYYAVASWLDVVVSSYDGVASIRGDDHDLGLCVLFRILLFWVVWN